MSDRLVATAPPPRTDAVLGHWFRRTLVDRAAMRLFCLPYAGGSARIYRNWHDWVAPDLEVVAIELPGRGMLLRASPVDRMDVLVPALLAAMEPLLDRPFAIFGHSMGALVAFELSRVLVSSGGPTPVHLFASAMRAPHLPSTACAFHTLTDRGLVDAVRALNGTPPEVIEHRELLEILLPTLRADFHLSETYRCPQIAPLPLPITVFGGLEDDGLTREDLEGWQAHTAGPCVVRLLPGDHFFMHEHEHLITASIRSALRSCTASRRIAPAAV
jgi:medium-chain acyl-[acyl-carrier-protein] hydrolase